MVAARLVAPSQASTVCCWPTSKASRPPKWSGYCCSEFRSHLESCSHTLFETPGMPQHAVCMYVSIYLCIYVCMYACMHVCMYVSIYVSMYLCMYLCMYVCMYVCMYAWCLYACMYVCMFACAYVSVCVNLYGLWVIMYVFFCTTSTTQREEVNRHESAYTSLSCIKHDIEYILITL